jgi:hypothetical protein
LGLGELQINKFSVFCKCSRLKKKKKLRGSYTVVGMWGVAGIAATKKELYR